MTDIITIIAEQLTNMFPGEIHDLPGKAKRLYSIMKLEKSQEEQEQEEKVVQMQRILSDLKEL